MNSTNPTSARLYSLDALRGVAALAVVFWHWQHFSAIGPSEQPFNPQLQPQYRVFRLFYDQGWLAVDLFFSLSGFIFFWLYSKSISQHQVSPAQFFILRFSRLYPLHIATLLFCAIAQVGYIALNGRGFIYGNTDLGHFALNILLISSLGIEKGFSFNGPIWSVSVESSMYVAFFALCRLRLNKPGILVVISAIGFSLIYNLYPPIGRGIGSFFLGGFIYSVYTTFNSRANAKRISIVVIGVTTLLWIATFAHFYLGNALKDIPNLWRLSGTLPGRGFAEIVLLPMTILSLAMYESNFSLKIAGLEFLGSISYSSYLLHFPLQLSLALLLPLFGLTSSFFQTNFSLILFFVLLVSLSVISFKYFEMPAQQHIRKKLLTPRSSGAPMASHPGPD